MTLQYPTTFEGGGGGGGIGEGGGGGGGGGGLSERGLFTSGTVMVKN